MNLRKVDRIGIAVIACILLLSYTGLFKGEWAKIALLKAEKERIQLSIQSKKDTTIEFNQITDEVNRIQRKLDDFERQLPGEKRVYEFIRSIDRLARKHRVRLERLAPGKMKRGALYSRVPISLTTMARFADFYRFLYDVENIPRITKMEKLSIIHSADEDVCKVQMTLSVFVGGV